MIREFKNTFAKGKYNESKLNLTSTFFTFNLFATTFGNSYDICKLGLWTYYNTKHVTRYIYHL